ncbi:MAG TPA: signal peptide peptidase SppA [Candidatus Prevotella stercoripullorum]|nr:signal peptide peptidase SppA [Candidatus Prevotella stercoripullorum]
MKDFFKYMSATVVGLIVFTLITGIIGAMCIVGMIASGSSAKDVSDNSVMVINLSGMLNERSESTFMDEIGGNTVGTIGLDDVLAAIDKAEDNDKIKGIYIEAGMLSADSYASLTAIRNALLDFKKSGKWIVAYGDVYTQGVYYVASVADKVFLNPSGQVDWHGIASQPIFLKDLMAKFGVKMQLAKVGAYKSAPEMFTADKMSDANREQVTAYINGLWQNICKGVSESRKISVAQLNAYADSFVTLSDAKDFVKYKFVDKLIYTDGIKAEINKLLKNEADDDINTVSLADMKVVKGKEDKGEEIAVYYAYGDIVDSETGGMMSSGHSIVGKTVCQDLEDLMEDDDVKAVVLRINSGGGSAYASEQIWHYVEMLKKKKPVVVSMGGMAASGGYYISSGANWIVAEPTTLTGSIGIFGMFPDMSELLTQKLGVKFDEVKTNRHSAFGTPARPFNEEEMRYLNKYIDRGYNLFRQRVAQGRKMKVENVEKIAQGRVWLGQDALKIKLVDELGGLDKAIAKAAQLAKLKEYHTSAYPGKVDWLDQLLNKTSGGSYIKAKMRQSLGEYYEPFMLLKDMNNQSAIQARVPFMMNIK